MDFLNKKLRNAQEILAQIDGDIIKKVIRILQTSENIHFVRIKELRVKVVQCKVK